MAKKYNICILANNVEYLDVLLRNFPGIEKANFIVVNEVRYKPCYNELKEVLDKYGVQYDLIRSSTVCKFVYDRIRFSGLQLTEQGMQFFKSYRMGMKVLLPYYVLMRCQGKVWLCDDDCIFLQGWETLFECDVPNLHKAPFVNYFRPGQDYTDFFLKLAECDDETWKRNYVLNGHFMMSRKWYELDDMLDMIVEFFNSEVCQLWWEKYLSGKNTGRGWFLDMNWFNALHIRLLKKKELSLGRICELAWIGKGEKKQIRKPGKKKVFIHYAIREKQAFLDLAIKEKIII